MDYTERDLQDLVAELAGWAGWRVAHFRNSRTPSGGHATAVQYDGAGFPDLTLTKAGRVIFAELKSQKGRVSENQTAWLLELQGPHTEVYVWRPSDWLDGTIRRILTE